MSSLRWKGDWQPDAEGGGDGYMGTGALGTYCSNGREWRRASYGRQAK